MLEKTIITIDAGIIKMPENETIKIGKEEILNTIKWTFKAIDEISLQIFTDEFMKLNQKYLISFNDMSLEKLVVNQLHKQKLTISFAESCTGGMLVSTIINVNGASNVINESYVTYSEEAKIRILKVNKQTIKKYGVYSPNVAEEMADGLYKITNANVCVSVTGQANIGTFDFAIYLNYNNVDYFHVEHHQVKGTRNEVRTMQTTYILWQILQLITNHN